MLVLCSPRVPRSVLSTASFSERVRNMSPDEIKIPPEPPGRCSNHLQVSEGLTAVWVRMPGLHCLVGAMTGKRNQVKLPGGQEPAVLDLRN